MSMLDEIQAKTYSFQEMNAVLKGAGVKPNSFKEVKVLIELTPIGWVYGVTGYSGSSRTIQSVVKGFEVESGSTYIDELLPYPLKVKVLDTPIPINKMYEMMKHA